jgi:hypothetical protein
MARAEIPVSALNEHPDIKNDEAVLKWIIGRIEKRAGGK